MKIKIYNFLVNRHIGIKQRYHRFHDKACGVRKLISWLYLLWLNFAYYVLFCRFIGRVIELETYEQKRLVVKQSESGYFKASYSLDVNDMIEKLKKYEIISFDIFDTLIFRPFSSPTDLFFIIGEKLGFMDFKHIRIEAEIEARRRCKVDNGHYEVNLEDIWNIITEKTGIPKEEGIKTELELETELCYANPFMKQVYDRLKDMGKRILLISDMYISSIDLRKILESSGYVIEDDIFVSCEYGKNKADGSLYVHVKENLLLSSDVSNIWIHVGDNKHSDIDNARKNGIATCYYPNINTTSYKYRSYDMSPIIGGAYRGIVNEHIYNGLAKYSMEYEYGYIYGGLFVLGYCNFIHEYCKKNAIDKVLFLSRDGDILKQVYDLLYDEKTEYVYWSRRVGTKLMSKYNRYDYYRRFIHHKVNCGFTIDDILKTMELESLSTYLPEGINGTDKLTNGNEKTVWSFIAKHWEKVQDIYLKEHKAARQYFEGVLAGAERACAVDIGWAGSGAIYISYLVEKAWGLKCKITGIVAGTNTVHNSEPDTSETFLLNGRLVAYMFSQMHNRDLMKKHNPNIDYNVYWELLLSSPTKHFKGFKYNEQVETIELTFGEHDYNKSGIEEIQRGIMDFAKDYKKHFEKYEFMFNVSGRDAYAPMMVAASNGEHYLKAIEKRFKLEANIV